MKLVLPNMSIVVYDFMEDDIKKYNVFLSIDSRRLTMFNLTYYENNRSCPIIYKVDGINGDYTCYGVYLINKGICAINMYSDIDEKVVREIYYNSANYLTIADVLITTDDIRIITKLKLSM